MNMQDKKNLRLILILKMNKILSGASLSEAETPRQIPGGRGELK